MQISQRQNLYDRGEKNELTYIKTCEITTMHM